MRHCLFLLLVFPILVSCKDQLKKKIMPGEKDGETVQLNPSFTETTACLFSEIAYCDDPQQQLNKNLPGWKVVWNSLAIGGNHAFVASDGAVYVIAFRGSLITFSEDAFNNWIYHDLNVAIQESWPYSNASNARISQGSWIAWQNLEKMKDRSIGKTLWAFLAENITDDKPLILTGHSLGGNLAIIYASYLWWKFKESGHIKNNINVITFAAPAPGNRAFAKDFDAHFPASVRVENTNDIVPKFPVSGRMEGLGDLYSPLPSASAISVGYKNVETKLSTVFTLLSNALLLLELRPDFSGYSHTNADGKLISILLSGKNMTNSAAGWFAEAGYQHSMAQYAFALGAPVISCE